ncbi:MAG: TetR/AcrR family transcriptional regulator [Solirubrobacteraceae bacterium]|nr:TetR/AcrR family transcriptional regulator [Patulibacter sp.]
MATTTGTTHDDPRTLDVSASAAAPSVDQPNSGSDLKRPGGRSARVRAEVHRAARELLAELPAESLTVPVIAARAGVHATTVYRRWGSVGEILADVTASRAAGEVVVPDTGSLSGDLRRWVADVAVDLSDPDVIGLMRASLGSGLQTACSACVVDRRAQLEAILTREQDRGGAAPEVHHAADLLLGPLYYRAVFLSEAPDPSWAATLVDNLLR